MESLNMNTLASSLPNSVSAEKQLMDNFKAAALSITTLYRSSLDTSKRSYSAGYATCLMDVLNFVQAGVSVSGNEGEEMTIGRVMDWLEARLEAIKSTEEEEEEDGLKEGHVKATQEEPQKDEREKRHRKGRASSAIPVPRLHRRSKENLQEASQLVHAIRAPPSPPAFPFASPSPPPSIVRPIKQRRGVRDLNQGAPLSADVAPLPATIPRNTSPPFTFSSDVISAIPMVGSKRRHATMISEALASSSVETPSSPITPVSHSHGHTHPHSGGRRKRGRATREREAFHGANGAGNGVPSSTDSMDVEEESGRDRKRVARR